MSQHNPRMLSKPLVLLMAGDGDHSEEIAARLLATRRFRVMVSEPAELQRIPGDVHRGGFASARAMAEMLEWDQVRAVIDASEPYDTETPGLAADACQRKGVPRLRLMRPGWEARDCKGVRRQARLDEAARALPLMGRCFLSIRPQDIGAFEIRRDVWYQLRIHQPRIGRFPLRRGDFALGQPPFTQAHEQQLLSDCRIDSVVAQDTGLKEDVPLLAAARALGLAIHVIDRPPQPRGQVVESEKAAVTWLMKRL